MPLFFCPFVPDEAKTLIKQEFPRGTKLRDKLRDSYFVPTKKRVNSPPEQQIKNET